MGSQACSVYIFIIFSPLIALNVSNACTIELVESIPEGLVYPEGSPTFLSTYEAWNRLLKLANKTIDIGAMYWTLRGTDSYNHTSAWQGEDIFEKLLSVGTKGNISIRIAQSASTKSFPNRDTEILAQQNAAEVRSVDFPKLLGAGILHTKLWVVDGQHMYVGSANLDWRSLTQVKELGVLLTNCPILVNDLSKIFEVYWDMGKPNATIPPSWPTKYNTRINATNPISIDFNDKYEMNTFFSDIDAILHVIQKAEKFIHISVMDYIPLSLFTAKPKFWPVIDNALRAAAIDRRVSVKLLISLWKSSRPAENFFLNSLRAISKALNGVDVQVKRFKCPATEDQSKIPFARVNHNKYMVTDNAAYIGTSNWSADYFIDTAGIGFVLEEPENVGTNGTAQSLRSDLVSIFERDWNSTYTFDMSAPAELCH